jgi:ribosomal protein S18 acetylase RimI-like enzyme
VVDHDIDALRASILGGSARLEVVPLRPDDLDLIAWSGGPTHLEHVRRELGRVEAGEVDYLAVRVGGVLVAKGGIDFAAEAGAGTIWQVATHPRLQGLGLATCLIGALEARALRRGVHRLRLAVEVDNPRARRLYERLGYESIGESETAWEADAEDGSRFLYRTRLTEMAKEAGPSDGEHERARHEEGSLAYTGTLLAESLRPDADLSGVALDVRRIRRANAGDAAAGQPLTWTFIEFLVPEASAGRLADLLGAALAPGPWYCDFRNDNETVVVFAGRLVRYRRGDPRGRAEAEAHARFVGVPESQIDWPE